jgi:hypothetical protein
MYHQRSSAYFQDIMLRDATNLICISKFKHRQKSKLLLCLGDGYGGKQGALMYSSTHSRPQHQPKKSNQFSHSCFVIPGRTLVSIGYYARWVPENSPISSTLLTISNYHFKALQFL